MQKLLNQRGRATPAAKAWAEINGVRLTKVDETQQYASDTIAQVLENQDRARHVARVAHLYFARHPVLPQADLEVHLLSLIRKIFGPSPMIGSDWGWMGSMSFRDLPRSIRDELRRDLDSTFDESKWSAEHLKGFRVFQLMVPGEPENLFAVIYCRPNGPYQYLFPLADLPARTEELLQVWRAGRVDIVIPELYREVFGDPVRMVEGFLQLDLADWYTLRFLNWYSGYVARSPQQQQSQSSLDQSAAASSGPGKRGHASLYATSLTDLKAGNPPFELLHEYVETFIPHARTDQENELVSLRAKAVFRWAIADLWLNRVKLGSHEPSTALPNLRLLQSLFILITHVASDPGLFTEDNSGRGDLQLSKSFLAFRAALHRFFLFALSETSFLVNAKDTSATSEASFDMIVDLWNVYLSPWKATLRSKGHEGPLERLLHRTAPDRGGADKRALEVQTEWLWFVIHNYCSYLHILHKTLDRLDQESNPSLEALEALARAFNPEAHGPFSPSILGALLGCDSVWTSDGAAGIPEVINHSQEAKRAFQFVLEHKDVVVLSIRSQYEELGFRDAADSPRRALLSPIVTQIKGFIRELIHKRKAQQNTGLPGLTLVGASAHKDIQQICRVFSIEPTEDEHGSSAVTRLHGPPQVRWTEGVPRWLSDAGNQVRARYRSLTAEGKRRIRDGEGTPELAMQYVGDFSKRPIDVFEVPVLVRLSSMVNDSVAQFAGVQIDVRPFADARNILWMVIVFNLLMALRGVNRGWATWVFAAYCMGAGVLRGPSEKLWGFLFASIVLYQVGLESASKL